MPRCDPSAPIERAPVCLPKVWVVSPPDLIPASAPLLVRHRLWRPAELRSVVGSDALRARVALLGLLLVASALWMAWLSVYLVDDAYIVFRYAENLARGNGFVFNLGERVEGVTCFLWTLLVSGVAWLGLPLPRVVPILTALCGLATVALIPGLAARSDGRDRWEPRDLIPALLVAAHPGFAYWSVGALETIPYTLLLVLAVRVHSAERDGRRVVAAGWMAASALVRPEAPLVAGAMVLDRLPRLRPALRWTGLFTAVFGAFVVFRRVYFGDWLPNTYYAKTGAGLPQQVNAGWNYTRRFLWEGLLSLPGTPGRIASVVLCVLFGALIVWGLSRKPTRPAALVVAATTVAVFLEGGDWMPLFRFYVPTLPFLAILLTQLGREVLAKASPGWGRTALWLPATAVVVAAMAAWGVRTRNGGHGLTVNAQGYEFAHHQIARLLRERARPGDTVALMDVGIVGYESGLRILDISGLVTREIAHAPGGFLAKSYPPELVLAKEPRFVVLVPGFAIDGRIALSPAFQTEYRLIARRNHRFNWVPPGSYEMCVFERTLP